MIDGRGAVVLKARPDDELYVVWDTIEQMPWRWWAGGVAWFSRAEDWAGPALLDRADLLGSSAAEAPCWSACLPVAWAMNDLHRGLLPWSLLLDFAVLVSAKRHDHAAQLVTRYGALVPR